MTTDPPDSRAPRASRPHMPGYGLPEGTEGLMPWQWAEQRLTATTTTGSRPRVRMAARI